MSRHGHGQVNYPARVPDHREIARRRSLIDAARPVIIDLKNPDDVAKLAEFDERKDELFDAPRWLAKRILKRQWRFRNNADRLTTCLSLLYPKGLPPTRGEIAFNAEQACSVPGLDVDDETLPIILRRAADAAEDLFRRGYTIPRDTVLMVRAAMAARDALTTTTAREESHDRV